MTQKIARYRVALSLDEINIMLSYLEKDAPNYIANAELILRLQKQKKKIQFELIDPAYLATETTAEQRVTKVSSDAFQLVRERIAKGEELSMEEIRFFASYMTEHGHAPASKYEEEILNNYILSTLS